MKIIGTRLKELRFRQKGLSLRELAKQAHMSHSFIADIEAGRSNPSLDTIEALAKVLNISIDYLLGRTEDPRPLPGAYPIGKIVKIPVLGVIRAGDPILAVENIIGWEEIPAEDIQDGDYFFLLVPLFSC